MQGTTSGAGNAAGTGGSFDWLSSLAAVFGTQQSAAGASDSKIASDSKSKFGGIYSASSMPSLMGDANSNAAASAYQENAGQQSAAIDLAVDKIGSNTGNFGRGMKVGYAAVMTAVAPALAYRQAKQTKQIYSMQAQLSDMQAQAYQTAAEDTLRAGQQQVAAVTFQHGQQHADTRVSQAASGIAIGASGSAAEVMASQAIATEFQVNQLMANAVTASWGYRRQQTAAKVNSMSVRALRGSVSPFTSAVISGITAASNAAPSVASAFGGGAAAGSAAGGSK